MGGVGRGVRAASWWDQTRTRAINKLEMLACAQHQAGQVTGPAPGRGELWASHAAAASRPHLQRCCAMALNMALYMALAASLVSAPISA